MAGKACVIQIDDEFGRPQVANGTAGKALGGVYHADVMNQIEDADTAPRGEVNLDLAGKRIGGPTRIKTCAGKVQCVLDRYLGVGAPAGVYHGSLRAGERSETAAHFHVETSVGEKRPGKGWVCSEAWNTDRGWRIPTIIDEAFVDLIPHLARQAEEIERLYLPVSWGLGGKRITPTLTFAAGRIGGSDDWRHGQIHGTTERTRRWGAPERRRRTTRRRTRYRLHSR